MAANDLALDQDDIGTRFVTWVVIMMTALATLAVGGALIVQDLRGSWVEAIRGHMTIEIPAASDASTIRGDDLLNELADKMQTTLKNDTGVADVHIISNDEVKKLVEPWLGENAGSDDLPLPRLLALDLKNPGDADTMARVTKTVTKIDEASGIETHQAWLSDLKRFSLALLLAALAMTAATVACTIMSVAGAVRSRLAAHHDDIRLLHVMGATDYYIGGQFVRVTVRNVSAATFTGMVIGLLLLKAGGFVAGGLQSAMLPAFNWNAYAFCWFVALPALITALCWGAARFTVLRSLRSMP